METNTLLRVVVRRTRVNIRHRGYTNGGWWWTTRKRITQHFN
ncbi:hypothetical protein [Salmonella enterica]|nr:hypothetical protein [Salmonella enterica]